MASNRRGRGGGGAMRCLTLLFLAVLSSTEVSGRTSSSSRHPFQRWLHSHLEDFGNKVSAKGATRPGRDSLMYHRTSKLAKSELLKATSSMKEDVNASEGMIPIDVTSNVYMDQGEFERKSEEWMKGNQGSVQSDMQWILVGCFLLVISTGVLVYSEVRYVLITREYDLCVQISKPIDESLSAQLSATQKVRTYLSIGSVLAMVVSLWIILFPLCHLATGMLSSMGYAFHGCYELAFMVAFVVAAVWSLFVIGCCWLCTRPWTAIFCFIVSFVGEAALETGQAPAVLMWILASLLSAYIFFTWARVVLNEDPKPDPEKSKLVSGKV